MAAGAASTTLKVIAVGFLLFCAGFLVLSAPMYWRQVRILKSWKPAGAQVVGSRVVALSSRSGETLYDAEYTFAFAAEGRPVLATSWSNHQSTSRRRKEKQVARFPPGMQTTILYNPANPSDIRMQPGYNVHFFAVPLFVSGTGAIFGVFALLLWGITRVIARPTASSAHASER